MQSTQTLTLAAAVASALMAGAAAQAAVPVVAPIRIELFSNHVETPGVGISFSNPFGEQGAFAINFGLSPAAPWWPLGDQQSFGARLTSGLQVASAGSYQLTLGGDDATYLFIDGTLVLSQPGDHSYYTSQVTLDLVAGVHTMELQFYNGPCCGSVLTLDVGSLSYVTSPVPEPSPGALWLAGLTAGGVLLRRRGLAG